MNNKVLNTRLQLPATVHIKPILRRGATNVHALQNMKMVNGMPEMGKRLNKTKMSSSCKDGFRYLYSKKVGGLLTGLDKVVENPYFVKDEKERASAATGMPTEWQFLLGAKTLPVQDILEYEHGKPKGYYSNRAPHKDEVFSSDNRLYTWDAKWKFGDSTNILKLHESQKDQLIYYWALASKFVSNDPKERSLWPRALYMISSEADAAEDKINKVQRMDAAVAALSTMPQERLVKVAKVLGWTKSLAPEYPVVYSTVSSKIKESKFEPGSDLFDFEDIISEIKSPEGKSALTTRAFVEDLLNHRVVTFTAGMYKHIKTDTELGRTKPEVVTTLMKEDWEEFVKEAKKELAARLVTQ